MLKGLYLRDFLDLLKLLKKRTRMVYLLLLLAGSGFFSITQIILAFINKDMINAITDKSMSRLEHAVLLGALMTFIMFVLTPIITYFTERTIRRAVLEMRKDLFQKLLKLPVSYFERNHSGDVISRSTNDLNVLLDVFQTQIGTLLNSLLWGIGSIVMTFALDWRLSFVMMFLGILSLAANLAFTRPMRSMSDQIQTSYGELTQHLRDSIAGYRVMNMFNISRLITEKYFRTNRELSQNNLNRAGKYAQMGSVTYIIDLFSVIGVIIFGSMLVAQRTIDLGTVMAIVTLQAGVSFMFSNTGYFFANVQASLAGSRRIGELLDEPDEPERYPLPAASSSDPQTLISMEDIGFSYDGRHQVVDKLSLSIEEGQTVALVGPSGGGKSTIIKLLLGFYSADAGRMTVKGKALKDYTQEELRSLFSYVPQEAYLFDGTILENIRYGNPRASDEEVYAAAVKANAHSFIIQSPEGYQAKVGERGVRLSGGQRQRIAIARAFLKDAPILLLDEATSALDSENEVLVQHALNHLMAGRTVVAIAHRLSTIEKADRIYVIENGRVVESGTHEQLLDDQKVYHRLHSLQFA